MTGITDYCIGCKTEESGRDTPYFGSGDTTFPVGQKKVRPGVCEPCRYDIKVFERLGYPSQDVETLADSRKLTDMALVDEVYHLEMEFPQPVKTLEASLVR